MSLLRTTLVAAVLAIGGVLLLTQPGYAQHRGSGHASAGHGQAAAPARSGGGMHAAPTHVATARPAHTVHAGAQVGLGAPRGSGHAAGGLHVARGTASVQHHAVVGAPGRVAGRSGRFGPARIGPHYQLHPSYGGLGYHRGYLGSGWYGGYGLAAPAFAGVYSPYGPNYYYSPDYYASPPAVYAYAAPSVVVAPDDTVAPDEAAILDESALASPEAPPPAPIATVEVRLPDPQAVVWFNGQDMATTGPVRDFVTPPLVPGRDYSYNVVATWDQDGQRVTDQRLVHVSAGGTTVVDFSRPADIPELPVAIPAPAP